MRIVMCVDRYKYSRYRNNTEIMFYHKDQGIRRYYKWTNTCRRFNKLSKQTFQISSNDVRYHKHIIGNLKSFQKSLLTGKIPTNKLSNIILVLCRETNQYGFRTIPSKQLIDDKYVWIGGETVLGNQLQYSIDCHLIKHQHRYNKDELENFELLKYFIKKTFG